MKRIRKIALIPKATEDTITSLLKDELERLGVKAEAFSGITTPSGLRKPDILCTNGGMYPLEAKFTERDLISAIAKVQNDYLKYYKVLGIKGGFAILYSEKLATPMPIEAVRDLAFKSVFRLVAMFPPEDARPFRVYDGKLEEVAKVIAEHVLTPPKHVEPSIDYMIKSLRDAAIYVLNGLKHLASHDLEGFFGGKDVFKNILQYEEERYPVEELRFAAAYLLINQLLFYHVLSRLRKEFEEIDPDTIGSPVDLNRYFARVLDVNYKVVFSYDVASLIPPKFSEEIRIIANVVKGLSPEKVGGDLLGTIFHDLIPFEVRKRVAAYYTNVVAAELLAALSIGDENAKVADLAAGSGGLLVAAYRRKRALLKEPFTQDVHRQFVEKDILGVDVMPFAANIAACHLALQSPENFTDKLKMAIWDSTDLKPGMMIPSVAELKTVLSGQTFLDTFASPEHNAKGVVTLGKQKAEDIKLEPLDLLIMNPPFTRQERIPESYKEALLDRFSDYKGYLHGQMGFYGYFILLADRFLKEGGKMALVLPATVLRVRSCEGLRQLWAEKYHIEHIITTSHRSAFSESVSFREMLLIASRSSPSENAKTKLTVLKRLPQNPAEARALAQSVMTSKKDLENDMLIIRHLDYSKLTSDTGNWFKYLAVGDLSLTELFETLSKSDKLEPLSSTISIIRGFELRGGLVTALLINSKVERAIKSGDVWILSGLRKNSVMFHHKAAPSVQFKVPINSVRRTIRRASGVSKIDASEELDHVIVKNWDKREFARLQNAVGLKFSDALMRGISNDVDRRTGNVFIVRRLNLSAPHTHALAYYSSKPAAPTKLLWSLQMKEENAKILTLYLNSTINLLQSILMRAETEGAFMDFSEYILDEFLVVNPNKLTLSERRYLLRVFDKVGRIELPSLLEQLEQKHNARVMIDKAWLKVLRYNGNVDELLDNLYSSLANEINSLKRIMSDSAGGEDDSE